MAFISEIIGRPVTDIDGKQVGVLQDVIARTPESLPHPLVQAIEVDLSGQRRLIPYDHVAALLSKAIPLKGRLSDLQDYLAGEADIYLVRDVLDKQIIDTDGARVVRVNDLELLRVNGSIFVSNVDVGFSGILRRLGLGKFAQLLGSGSKKLQNYISWDEMELLQHDQYMRLKVPVKKLSELHPADIAEIISDLNRMQGAQFLEALDLDMLADALEEVEPEFQASLIENMDDERVADVLEEMDPDDAADLLAELPAERSKELLGLMEDEDAEDVRKLLAYPEDTAGGIMTTEYASIPPGLTAEQAIQWLRDNADEAETINYIYVIDALDHIIGVCSLKALVLAHPETPISQIMKTNIVSVAPLDDQDEVARIVAKYNLQAVPVVDEHNQLHGIVTADDALDKIIPTAWKKRLPRFYS